VLYTDLFDHDIMQQLQEEYMSNTNNYPLIVFALLHIPRHSIEFICATDGFILIVAISH
jgi:hypothetical protein